MKLLIILFALAVSGCTDADKRMLKAEITGEKFTVFIPDLGHYKVNKYHINDGVVYFEHNGSKYKSNVWTVKTTKVEE